MTFHFDARTRSLVTRVDDPFAIRDLLPGKSVVLDHAIGNIALPHSIETTKILRNLGYDAPTPLQTAYSWPGKYTPYEHQRVMADFHLLNDKGFNLSEPGAMKTNSALWATDYLMLVKKVRRCLIVSSLSTLERVWMQDIFDTLMHRTAVIVHGSREKREAALKKDCDFYIMNHDGVTIDDTTKQVLARGDIDLVIVDEGSIFRNHSTQKFKKLEKFLKHFGRIWWLTGTPVPNAPTDAWAQARIINPTTVPVHFGGFKRQTMLQVTQFKWAPKAGANEAAFAALQPAVRFMKKDVIDLPPVITLDRQATLTKEQRRAFDEMKNVMTAEIALRHSMNMPISAVNAADKIGKLRQILCGAIKDPQTGAYITIPHQPRFDVLLECVEQANAKVIVVVPFKGIINNLAKELRATKKDAGECYTVGVLNGDVSPSQRNKIISEFKHTDYPHILLCHPKVMAHGLNLTEADTLIFYAPHYSNDEVQQVIERFNRAGQTRTMTIWRIGAHPMEWAIYRMVDTRKLNQDSVLALYQQVGEGKMK